MGDLELARRVMAGDEAACELFFAGHFSRLYRFARVRLGGDDQAAEDVVQATFILAVRKLHTYRGEATLFTWLCTLCRREIGVWFDRTGKRAEVPLVEDHPDVRAALEAFAAGLSGAPDTELGRRELSRLVQVTLDHMPTHYGQILEWRYIQGRSVDEIASRLDLGYKATESLLTRARQAFRQGFTLLAGSWPTVNRTTPSPREP